MCPQARIKRRHRHVLDGCKWFGEIHVPEASSTHRLHGAGNIAVVAMDVPWIDQTMGPLRMYLYVVATKSFLAFVFVCFFNAISYTLPRKYTYSCTQLEAVAAITPEVIRCRLSCKAWLTGVHVICSCRSAATYLQRLQRLGSQTRSSRAFRQQNRHSQASRATRVLHRCWKLHYNVLHVRHSTSMVWWYGRSVKDSSGRGLLNQHDVCCWLLQGCRRL